MGTYERSLHSLGFAWTLIARILLCLFYYLCVVDKLNRIIESYPPELKLLLVCCGSERWKEPDLLPQVDWDQFFAWIKRHRVTPAVYRYIKKNPAVLPEMVGSKIKKEQERITRKALLLTSELIRIGKLFDEHNIPWFTIKGPILAHQLYGDVAGRDYRDLDVFVNEKYLHKAIDLLNEHNYISIHKLDLKRLIKVNHNVELVNKKTNTKIEVHWRFFASKVLSANFKDVDKTINVVAIQNEKIITCDDAVNLLYIFIHSALHQWGEMQWVNDCRDISNNYGNELFKGQLENIRMTNVMETFITINNILFKKINDKLYSQTTLPEFCLNALLQEKSTFVNKLKKTKYLSLLSDDKDYKMELVSLRLKRLLNNPAKRKL